MRTFTVNLDSTSPKTGLVTSLENPSPSLPLEFTLGDICDCELFLISGSPFLIDALSGNAALSIKVGTGTPGSVPTSGTFMLTFGGQTTAPLAYNCTTAQLQAALVALSSMGANNVSVQGAFPVWQVQFIGSLALAAQGAISADNTKLFPVSSIDISHVQNGSAIQNEIQAIKLSQMPLVFQGIWTPIVTPANGWSGTLGFNTLALAQAFTPEQPYLNLTLEFQYTDTDGSAVVFASPTIKVYSNVIDLAAIQTSNFMNAASGIYSIPNGVDSGTVSGLGLASIPRGVQLAVMIPNGGLLIQANVNLSSIATTGFTFDLTGITDNPNYKLFYTLAF